MRICTYTSKGILTCILNLYGGGLGWEEARASRTDRIRRGDKSRVAKLG